MGSRQEYEALRDEMGIKEETGQQLDLLFKPGPLTNGGVKVGVSVILILLVAVSAVFLGISVWPFKVFKSAVATAQPEDASGFRPGCAMSWEVKFEEPTSLPVHHEVQLIVEYPGADWILSYEGHTGSISTREGQSAVEHGVLTLPKGKVMANRRFRLRHIYSSQFLWKPFHQVIRTPWYTSGDFNPLGREDCD